MIKRLVASYVYFLLNLKHCAQPTAKDYDSAKKKIKINEMDVILKSKASTRFNLVFFFFFFFVREPICGPKAFVEAWNFNHFSCILSETSTTSQNDCHFTLIVLMFSKDPNTESFKVT